MCPNRVAGIRTIRLVLRDICFFWLIGALLPHDCIREGPPREGFFSEPSSFAPAGGLGGQHHRRFLGGPAIRRSPRQGDVLARLAALGYHDKFATLPIG